MKVLWLVACLIGYFQATFANQMAFGRMDMTALRIDQPYVDRGFSSRYFDFGGDVIIRNDRYIRLTQDKPDQRGYFFSKLPLRLPNVQIEFEVDINGKGSSIYGDGMAFWLLGDKPTEGSVFGIHDNFNGLGIFIDTYKNDRPGKAFPYVMAMLGDGKTNYDHAHDGAANEIAGCSARGLHNSHNPSKFRFTYVKDRFMSLELDYKGKGEWEKCFVSEAPLLPDQLYVGFSAQTGELSSNHDLIESRTSVLRDPPMSFDDVDEQMNGRIRKEPAAKGVKEGGWGGTFLKLFLLVALLFSAYIGFGIYRANKKTKHEALYL